MKLSIITINYNNEIGLSETIQSIINQTFTDFEYIIIDGGSKDKSLNVIEKNTSKINYWISEPDNGIYHAMNKGIKEAKGEYCLFLNSGDYLAENNVLEKVFKKKPQEDILFGNLYVTLDNKIVEKAYGKKELQFSDIYSHIIKHQASFIKHNLFEIYGYYNESRKIVADWEFFIKAVGLGDATCKYFDVFIAYFDNDGISNRNKEIAIAERQEVIKEIIPKKMQADFEFLLMYRKYEGIYKNKLSFFFVRLINKILKQFT